MASRSPKCSQHEAPQNPCSQPSLDVLKSTQIGRCYGNSGNLYNILLTFSDLLSNLVWAATKARRPVLTHKKRVTAPFVCIIWVALPLKLSGSLRCLRPLHGLTLSGRGSRPRQLHDRPIVKATDRQTRPYARCPHPHVAHAISRQLPFAQGASTGVGYANGKSRGLVISSDVRKVANNAQMLAISPESRVVNGFLQDSDRLNDNLVRHCCVSRV
jgi:hypothetical protein